MRKKAELEALVEDQRRTLNARFQELQSLYLALEAEQKRTAELIAEQNALLEMLDDLFDLQVVAQDIEEGRPVWGAMRRSTGDILLRREPDLAQVYRQAIRKRLEEMP